MQITELQSNEQNILQSFKDKEYPATDNEHYGDNIPDFTEKEFTLISKESEVITGQIHIVIRYGIAYIDSLLIGTEYRGKGLGKQLVEMAELKAKKDGAHKIWLETGSTWSARGFYEKLGYAVRAILPNDVGHQECVLMDKML